MHSKLQNNPNWVTAMRPDSMSTILEYTTFCSDFAHVSLNISYNIFMGNIPNSQLRPVFSYSLNYKPPLSQTSCWWKKMTINFSIHSVYFKTKLVIFTNLDSLSICKFLYSHRFIYALNIFIIFICITFFWRYFVIFLVLLFNNKIQKLYLLGGQFF